MDRVQRQQTLLIDADDTLWENNIYFERAIADFISYLDHRVHTPQEVRSHLNRVEHETIAAHGYGLKSFQHSLATCFEQLGGLPLTEANQQKITSFARSIADKEIEVIPGVAETLADLSGRHHLVLVTKGDQVEQTQKLRLSGLESHFLAVEVLAEKNHDAYLFLAERHGWIGSDTWMIGNSPRSDINPALSAGFHAIFIPHHSTWVLEKEPLSPPGSGQRLLELASFAELSEYF